MSDKINIYVNFIGYFMEAFVYIWKNINTSKKYIGYHKGSPLDEYVSSSKSFQFWDDYHNKLLVREIVFIGTCNQCIEYESTLLKNTPVCELYNRNINGKILMCDDVKQKISKKLKGRPQSNEHIKNRSSALQGRKGGFAGKTHTEETIEKMKSVARTKQHKASISNALKGRPGTFKGMTHTKKTCPYCGKNIAINVFTRWHGDNCKENNK